ncbi:MAG: hypothetical protein RL207_3 [Bacteroidota bacterium]|jgi:hypothetical protein
MNRQEKIGSLIGDIGIPIFGFFFWNWSIYFICLFFLLDQLSREVSGLIRMHSIRQRVRLTSRMYFVHISSFVLCLLAVHYYVHSLHPEMNFLKEINDFFWFEDMGVAQGFVLIPIVLFSERLRYKMNTKLFTDEMHLEHWRHHAVQVIAYLTLFLSLSLILSFVPMSETTSFLCLLTGFTVITLFADKLSPFFPR